MAAERQYYLMAKPPWPLALEIYRLFNLGLRRRLELLHWTILCLGGAPDWDAPALMAKIDQVDTSGFTRFRLVFDQLVFGRHLILRGSETLVGAERFRAEASRAFAAARLQGARKLPAPHMTARYGNAVRAPTRPIDPISWEVDEVFLVESLQGQAHHNHLRRWPLR